ncbi:venom allergen 3-like [Copidosoma floridanum]|uniref:venom allergen 3-like n=1 Tax=Copidosoma floridanum TaxID=29053 RepID=UPI000C6F863B|nr:venom allergen 3-like [Copidosoma floridanum]
MRGLIFLLVVVAYTSAEYEQYCHLRSCKKDEKHTLCAYSSANKCARLISSGLSQDEKNRIVKLHNQLRQKVASGKEVRGAPGPQPPTATRKMANLVWDNEIARIAQHWADQCNYKHDQCKNTLKEEHVGQNIAYEWTTGDFKTIKVEKLIMNWYNEVDSFDGRTLQGISGKAVGHYTQMVWSKTNKIGCGAVRYYDGDRKTLYLVCNYGPGGNMYGEKVYDTKNNPTQNRHIRPQKNKNRKPSASNNNKPSRRPQPQPRRETLYPYTIHGKRVTKEEYEKFKNQPLWNHGPSRKPQSQPHRETSFSYTVNGKRVTKEEYEKVVCF